MISITDIEEFYIFKSCRNLDKRRLRRALTHNRLVITQHFTERTVTPGGDICMQYAATGDRPPQFVWERDGVTVSSNTYPSALEIKKVALEHCGTYTCVASNHVAKVNKSTELYIKAYSLTWKEASGPWQEVWSPNKVPNKLSNLSGVQKHALTGLKCGTKYSLRITATNKVGTSQPAYLDVSTLGGHMHIQKLLL
ncbi:unnamed protein product [Danaus chrysippus]|uniref:(African queen) hypothetical protein n=1 Tax=Danaus chrysippus TaxID=151541 RepID=A0A8J2R1P9_9NEOP|nr:unnamed protein product [Danaus chrysippus]